MYTLENEKCKAIISNGMITELYDKDDITGVNLSKGNGVCGGISYTLSDESLAEAEWATPYREYMCEYIEVNSQGNAVLCCDNAKAVNTKYFLDNNGLNIVSKSNNAELSQFAINLDFNFLGQKGYDYKNQILPTSPYMSKNNEIAYCIMTRPNGRFIVAVALSGCVGFRNLYCANPIGHYITGFQFFSDFDERYAKSENRNIHICINFADSLPSAYKLVEKICKRSMCINITSGGFSGSAVVKVSDGVDKLCIEKKDSDYKRFVEVSDTVCKVDIPEYGLYTLTPYKNGIKGLESVIWNGIDMVELFNKSCDSIRKPYHNDVNLCEGGCFLWAMLVNMRLNNNKNYNAIAIKELDDIMGRNGAAVPRRTILPYATEKFAAYHICDSIRIQEQFFGVSILLEAYKLYGDREYLEHAVKSLNELCDNWITDEGMIYNGSDYTTVCAPVIAIVDMANTLKEIGDDRYKRFENVSVSVADFIIKRGFDFPTEGGKSDQFDKEREDGSISCSALSVLYVCKNLCYKEAYIDFAKEIMSLHNAWTIYTPDARMLQSSFRYWETIWEGDGEGPAICAGHAWTIWRAEALYLLGMLTNNDKALLDSWNGYITNFAKIDEDGCSYSAYEADYIRGGGVEENKATLAQLEGEDISIKRVIAHSYPEHKDNSLSRYVWARAAYSWYDTAAIIEVDGEVVGFNINKNEKGEWIIGTNIKKLYVGNLLTKQIVYCKNDVKLYGLGKSKTEILYKFGR